MKTTTTVFALLLASQTVHAAPLTASELLEMCHGNHQMCAMYVMGVFEGLVMAQDPEIACVPPNLSYNSMTDAVVEGIKISSSKRPDLKKNTAVAAVSGILSGAFPCKR